VTKGPQNGSAHVLLDGQPAGSFNSYAATGKARMIVRVLSPSRAGDYHQDTITVVSDGTGRIDLDAVGVIHPTARRSRSADA
jgi:hypothetical protein